LQLHALAGPEIGIRHEGQFVMNVPIPHVPRLNNGDFHTANGLSAENELCSHELRDW
jgi:hypothetical protein